jgi:hypothetical protein
MLLEALRKGKAQIAGNVQNAIDGLKDTLKAKYASRLWATFLAILDLMPVEFNYAQTSRATTQASSMSPRNVRRTQAGFFRLR